MVSFNQISYHEENYIFIVPLFSLFKDKFMIFVLLSSNVAGGGDKDRMCGL